MKYEQETMERQDMQDQINSLQKTIEDMHSDFKQCAKGISQCFFCANDETCTYSDGCNGNFVWKSHN